MFAILDIFTAVSLTIQLFWDVRLLHWISVP